MAFMPIVLMTDFGSSDAYVGILKGVIARLAPHTKVLDLTHGIPPFNILQGAFSLAQAYRFFPEGTIFVAVVDPGVGSTRKPILAKTNHYSFIAPDNGLLTLVLELEKECHLFELDNPQYHLPELSGTFHARDIFVPVAAHLAQGAPVTELGSSLETYRRLPQCFPQLEKGKIKGCVLSIDHFGNCITNLERQQVKNHLGEGKWALTLGGKRKKLDRSFHHYSEGSKRSPFLIWGSSGYLEIALREGSAAKALKVQTGQEVHLTNR